MNPSIPERKEIVQKDQWNVEALYADWETWEKDVLCVARPNVKKDRWPELAASQFDLQKPQEVLRLLDLMMATDRALTKIYTYAHLRHDEEVSEERAKKAYTASLGALYAFGEEVSWVEPSFIQLEEGYLMGLLSQKLLKPYRVYLQKILRMKPHTLHIDEEKIVALAGKALQTSSSVFSALNNADLLFPPCTNEQGESRPLTHGTYLLYLRGKDRTLRKEAFLHLHETFLQYENTLCELLQGKAQQHFFYARVKKFSSCLEAALYPHEIDLSVYTSLISGVRKRLPFLHEYMSLRKKWLQVPQLHAYDLHVPLVQEIDLGRPYEEAVACVIDSVAILGEEYQSILRKGLLEDRWVDRYENKKKRSGAYSSGCYDGMPYILMNYHGTFQDMTTLSHEAGHSMHSYFSCKHQSYQDHQYPIFLAEVASTFHEELLFHHLVKQAKTKEEKAYLITQKIDDIRGTLFRQTMFAEFEWQVHRWVEEGIPLTPALLKTEYQKLNQEYYGKDLTLDEALFAEWSRIPHFYSNFYVYQYATGLSAAHALAKGVLAKQPFAKERFLEFLSSGGSLDPLTTLERAGVNMRTIEPVEALLCHFHELTKDLEKMLS